MKYQRLPNSELEKLKDDFVQFLIINGIEATDWEQLKSEEPTKSEQIIEQFSDVVYESIFRKNQYLEVTLEHEIMAFYFQPEQVVLVGLKSIDDKIDLRTLDDWNVVKNNRESFEVFSQQKSYKNEREAEMFQLFKSGAILSNGELFRSLISLI